MGLDECRIETGITIDEVHDVKIGGCCWRSLFLDWGRHWWEVGCFGRRVCIRRRRPDYSDRAFPSVQSRFLPCSRTNGWRDSSTSFMMLFSFFVVMMPEREFARFGISVVCQGFSYSASDLLHYPDAASSIIDWRWVEGCVCFDDFK